MSTAQLYTPSDFVYEAQPLAELMRRHDCDKVFQHDYALEYERHLKDRRWDALTILEIGIGGYAHVNHGGNGLKVWRDYFPFSMIHGLDLYTKHLDLGSRVKLWRGAQADAAFLADLCEQAGPFDVVIDDGSHLQSDIILTFAFLFPRLNPGGIYVIEDMETAYDPKYGGNPEWGAMEGTIRGLLAGMVDCINHEHTEGMPDLPNLRMIKSLHLSKEIAFIHHV